MPESPQRKELMDFATPEAMFTRRAHVAFCIHCGTRTQADAAFCSACGQTLYHEPRKQAPERAGRAQRYRVAAALLIVLGAALVVVLSVRDSTDHARPQPTASVMPRSKAESITDPVLMVVGLDRNGNPVAQGSGFILTGDGLAGSNYHVVEGAAQGVARCCSGRAFNIGTVEGADLTKDLVVFQLYERGSSSKPQNLPHVAFGSSQNLAVGHRVIAVGSPQGLQNTVSDGILSAVREYVRYLQITAPISEGSSGGPVFDANDQMVGIATFQFKEGQNLNFAIAAEHLRPLLDQHFQVSLQEFQSIIRQAEREQERAGSAQGPRTEQQKATPADELTGYFGGIVHNTSVNLSAVFGIVIRDDEGVLTGCMGVQQPLFGSGSLTGFRDSAGVVFGVTSAIGQITFVGKTNQRSISGSYTVEHDGAPAEKGTLTLKRINSNGPRRDFDTATCPTDAEMNQR